MKRFWIPARYHHPVMRGLNYALAIILVPFLAGIAGMSVRIVAGMRADPNPPPFTGALPAPPAHDPTKHTAVVIAANSGTEGSDFLGPYAVLAHSGAFNLYTVAPERRITHLFSGGPSMRGVDFVPHYSFAEYDAIIGSNPDLIVIPYLPFREAPEYQTIMNWIRAHAGPHTILLSVCVGARNLADTGLLNGRRATTHHYLFPFMELLYPDVRLVRGVRYLEDGNLISAAGVTAGVDGTLHVVERMIGADAARDVARQINYPHTRFLDNPSYNAPPTTLALLASPLTNLRLIAAPLFNVFLSGYRLDSDQVGVALYDGISELALASVVDTYPRAGTLIVNTVAPEREVVLSQHGLAFVPRWSFADAPRLDRLILPGSPNDAAAAAFERWTQERQQITVERVHQGSGYAYAATLMDMARSEGSAIATQAAYQLEYPIGTALATAPRYRPELLVRLLILGLAGLVVAGLIERRRVSRGSRQR
ncbi:DJ-1/PfpI family protein [Kallotenue papyrolyticum]|uniref:DJ-1/PfpI family protein n=1 Tax=Kallotenue papyrolyticum TaxID=1325125 RepID=UPI0004722705|nr:DJ-1/PfpI family protein [Kallotenue papyrolyticum]